jgi:hypothetical protein
MMLGMEELSVFLMPWQAVYPCALGSGAEVNAYDFSYSGGRGRGIMSLRLSWRNGETLSQKQNKNKRAEGIA